MVENDRLYSIADAAKILDTSRNKVYDLIHAGCLPALKLGSLKIRKSSLDKFIEEYENFDLSDPSNIKELRVG